jgi:hypothetical protein
VGARRQSLTEFLADHGFGEFGVAPYPQFPQYPPLNGMLQDAVLKGHKPEDTDLAMAIDLLRRATQEHEMGNYNEEQRLLAEAHRQLSAIVQQGGGGELQRKLIILLLVLAAAGVTWWAWKQAKKKKRRKRVRFQTNARTPKLVEVDEDEDEDEGDDPDEDDE